MDIARDICTESFYIVNSGLPCIAVTAVHIDIDIFHKFRYVDNRYTHIDISNMARGGGQYIINL